MCGRTACSRNREGVRCACAYKPQGKVGKQKPTKPQWLDAGQTYYPSYNVSPQSNTPVLLSSQHPHVTSLLVPSGEPTTERVLQVMKWGLVPGWHQGEPGKFPTLLNNCRSEGMMEKPSFRTAVQKKQRCVVLADGFFEWNRKSSHKQPYFIHLADTRPTPEMLELSSEEMSGPGKDLAEGQECIEGFSDVVNGGMLKMAGLFDVWRGAESENPLFTYTIITMEANPEFAHIHHRMPAVLHDDEEVEKWLDPSVPTSELIPMLKPSPGLAWYPVSIAVNNVRHKSTECVEKIDPRKQVSKQQSTLLKWFSAAPKKSQGDEGADSPKSKKPKLD